MAENRTRARFLRRLRLGAVIFIVVGLLSPVAGAEPSTKEKLEAAEAEFERVLDQIEGQQDVLERIMLETAEVAEEFQRAESRYEQITEELRNTTLQLRAAQDEFRGLRAQLEARAREAYITGPGNELEFLLGATSLADLTVRVEYMNALSETDADLATQVQNLKNELSAEKADQADLQAAAAEALSKVEAQKAALDVKFAEQQQVLDDLEAKKARAEELVKDLKKQYKKELAALTGVRFYANGVFKVCPVDPPRAVFDGFGAPRYGGGYHPHAGNDIIAPTGTPIRATFDGTARTSTNGLGGYAVYVYGEYGYTYNAHLMQPGVTGSVNAGDIVGYVGTSGNAGTPHNHFEWHPYTIPNEWPASPYGHRVIGSAVNPWPLLSQVC